MFISYCPESLIHSYYVLGLTGHYHHVAALGKLLTLNCLGGGTKQYMKGATIGSWLLCITLIALLYMSAIYVYSYVCLFAPTAV